MYRDLNQQLREKVEGHPMDFQRFKEQHPQFPSAQEENAEELIQQLQQQLQQWRSLLDSLSGPVRRGQTWDGTDRQCRGRLLAVVRDTNGAVTRQRLDAVWPDEVQRARCLAGLIEDGLVVRTEAGGFALP